MIAAEVEAAPTVRIKPVLAHVGVPASSYFYTAKAEPRRPGPARQPLDEVRAATVRDYAQRYPWWGYRRLAVVLRRDGVIVSNRFVKRVFAAHDLFQKPRPTAAELHQAAKLFELLPARVNALWQADVTYIHIPGSGWWYAVTVIDYYSRYLLALHLTPSYSAREINLAIDQAKAEAERWHGPLTAPPFLVTDNGTSFLAHAFRTHIHGQFQHVRTRYRTPQQLGLLERFLLPLVEN
jgi:putative transposase